MRFLLIALGIGAIWDGFTTVAGTVEILGSGGLQIMAAVVFALIIAGFLLGTTYVRNLEGILGKALQGGWWMALLYDLYTSYTGNRDFIMDGQVAGSQHVLLIGLTLLVTASPVLFSLIWEDEGL